jgi:hypothetical protein
VSAPTLRANVSGTRLRLRSNDSGSGEAGGRMRFARCKAMRNACALRQSSDTPRSAKLPGGSSSVHDRSGRDARAPRGACRLLNAHRRGPAPPPSSSRRAHKSPSPIRPSPQAPLQSAVDGEGRGGPCGVRSLLRLGMTTTPPRTIRTLPFHCRASSSRAAGRSSGVVPFDPQKEGARYLAKKLAKSRRFTSGS